MPIGAAYWVIDTMLREDRKRTLCEVEAEADHDQAR